MATKLSDLCKECHDQPVRVRRAKRFPLCDDCYRLDVIHRLTVRRVKRTLKENVGHPVQYNEGQGWRTGYLVSIGESRYSGAVIQPIGPLNAAPPDTAVVSLADIKPESLVSSRWPKVEDYLAMFPKRIPVLIAQPSAVQKTETSTSREQPKKLNAAPRSSNKTPFDAAEAVRLYVAKVRMKDIIEAVRGNRAVGATGNLVREACIAAGVYQKPEAK
jgi:hypothetical protein